MGTTTLQQILHGKTINSGLDIFDIGYTEKPTKYKEDPLVLACSVKALSEAGVGQYFSLDSTESTENITQEIRDHAEKVRKYYTKKYLWLNLKDNRNISDFRSRVCYLLENRVSECKDRDQGIYYKLPWFYDEDMIYDEFKQNYNTTDLPQRAYDQRRVKTRLNLTYVKSTISRQQKRKLERFWFTDQTYLYNIEVAQDNPLLEMFRAMIEPGKQVMFNTLFNEERIDKMYYYKMFQFSFVKE